MSEIDLMYTRDPVCPFCRKKRQDAWELHLHDSERETVNCGECGEEYEIVAHVTLEYSTSKPEPPEAA